MPALRPPGGAPPQRTSLMNFESKVLTIFGPGLLGGSLAGAIKRAGLAAEVRIWARRQEAAQAVVEKGWADFATDDVAAATRDADFLILATPVGVMKTLAPQIAAASPAESAVITDVGSVKQCVAEFVAPALLECGYAFIGSHPMAGREKTGLEAADPGLFTGRACLVTPGAAKYLEPASERVRNFWRALGCRVYDLTPARHDEAVAAISHLPHVAAAAVARAALLNQESFVDFAAGGFRDTTRVAAGPPDMWTEILLENRTAVAAALRGLQSQLGEVLASLENLDEEGLRRFLADARRLRLLAK